MSRLIRSFSSTPKGTIWMDRISPASRCDSRMTGSRKSPPARYCRNGGLAHEIDDGRRPHPACGRRPGGSWRADWPSGCDWAPSRSTTPSGNASAPLTKRSRARRRSRWRAERRPDAAVERSVGQRPRAAAFGNRFLQRAAGPARERASARRCQTTTAEQSHAQQAQRRELAGQRPRQEAKPAPRAAARRGRDARSGSWARRARRLQRGAASR